MTPPPPSAPRRPLVALVVAALIAGLGASCGEAATGPPDPGGRVVVHVAPLDLPGLVDVIYDLRVEDALGAEVWAATGLAASRYGDGTALTYVGPCDASPDAQPNRVLLTVSALHDAGGPLPAASWSDPTADAPLIKEVGCREDGDTPVRFDVTVMRRARQGFFDIAVELDDIFCSAKFDCHQDDAPLRLVHGPDGARLPSAVLALACTAGSGQDTWLYLDDLALDCGGEPVLIPADGGPGNVYAAGEAPSPLVQAMVFPGAEALEGAGATDLAKRYVNVALAVDFAEAGGVCSLTTTATAHDGPLLNGESPAGTYPVIRFEVPLVAGAGYGCGRMALDDPTGQAGDRVASVYVTAPPPARFDVGYALAGGALVPTRTGCSAGDDAPEGLCVGVCALEAPRCEAGRWICDGPGYEVEEVSCDGFDNDCDGEVDEGGVCVTCDDLGTCASCEPNLAVAQQYDASMADLDFDFDCNIYLTTLISGPDYTRRITPEGAVSTWYGNANQNMVFALVDPDPDNRRVVVTYSCCPTCGCTAQNGLTLLYTCAPDEPDCGCAGQSNCPGFLDAAFVTTGSLATSVSSIVTPTGLAAGPGNRYYVGNFRSNMCTSSASCVACDLDNPTHWCTPGASNCCASHTLGRLVEFSLPEPGVAPRWRLAYDFAPEQIIGLASARDGSVLVGTWVSSSEGRLWRFDPVTRGATLLQTFGSYVFSVTQNRANGDIYVETGAGSPKIHRFLESGAPAALPDGVPGSHSNRGVLQYGPDGRLYRLRFTGGPIAAYDLD